MLVKISPAQSAKHTSSDEFVERQLERIFLAAVYLGNNEITRDRFQEEFNDASHNVEAQYSHPLRARPLKAHDLYFDEVSRVFPDLRFWFKPFTKSWRTASTSLPIAPWFSKICYGVTLADT